MPIRRAMELDSARSDGTEGLYLEYRVFRGLSSSRSANLGGLDAIYLQRFIATEQAAAGLPA